MVLAYYKLVEQPFGVTPDPRYLYLSPTHREAIASVQYGVSVGRGFTALIAKPGMGKTTLIFHLLQQLGNSAKTVFLFQPLSTPRELLHSLLADLGIEDDGQHLLPMQSKLNEVLLRESALGKRFVLVLDEAQNLPEPVLEAVRMLSNFETTREKLMHIVLAGQPQLAETLSSTRMIQLRQRVSIVARLKPFSPEETKLYIDHRLRVAGYSPGTPLFSERAIALIAKRTEGIPRNINNVCFNAMSLGCALKKQIIDSKVIQEVLEDLELHGLASDLAPVPLPEKTKPPVPVLNKKRSGSIFSGARLRFAFYASVLVVLIWPFLRWNGPNSRTILPAPTTAPERSPTSVTTSTRMEEPSMNTESETTRPQPLENLAETWSTQASLPPASSGDDSQVIRVSPNKSIYRISMETFGTYNNRIVAKIVELNPSLTDPNHIQLGQELRLPASKTNFARTHPSAARDLNESGEEQEKP